MLAKKKIRVLVIDDSASVRQTMTAILQEDPEIEVIGAASDPFSAARRLQEEVPDVITLDVEMPRMDGFEFARNVRADAATKAIPIIMITSRTADKHRNHALEIGVNEYMGKPYQEDQLLALVKRYTQEAAFA